MLKCVKGIEGKKLRVLIKSTMKPVIIRTGENIDVPLTKDEEKELLKFFKFPDWKLEEVKEETKKKKKESDE